MSGKDSSWLSLKEDRNLITSLAASMSVSILEITASMACIEVEKHIFIEIASYLYRASAVIMELGTTENSSTNRTKILQALSKSIGFAKELTVKCQKCARTNLNPEVRSAIKQLQGVIKHIGEELSLIPSATFGEQEYAGIAAKSLSKEMKTFHFEVTQVHQLPEKKDLVTHALSSWERGKKEPTTTETDLYPINAEVCMVSTQLSERNEAARIKVAREALSLASTESTVFEALKNLQSIFHTKHNSKIQIQNMGMLPLLVKFLEYKNRHVRCATLELLLQLAEDGNEGKEMLAKTVDMSILIKMLSSNHQPIRHTSLLLLLELSRSQSSCQKIGSVTGGILMLITMKHKQSSDAFASEKADEILRNLERARGNIKLMAENGLLEPLLNHLIKGSEEMKMEMASYLGDIFLGYNSENQVAERASPTLIKMVQGGNTLDRKAAFRALKQISSYHPNSKVLVEAGIVRVMVEEMFTRTIYNEPMNSKIEAATILANILESGLELESLQVNSCGHTIDSDYIVYNIIYLIKNSTLDELNISLIRIILCLTKSAKLSAKIISVVKETEASYHLIELISNPNEELGVAAIKLLITLSPHMGHTLADRLCKTRGQPESLIRTPNERTQITEKHAVSANFLAKLPHQNLALNLALINQNTVPTVLQTIGYIQRSGTRTSRHGNAFFEGLVGILVRFTATLYDHQVLDLVRTNNFTSIFTELLMKTSSDEVQKLSAIGLEHLSTQSINLSKPTKVKKTKCIKLLSLPTCAYFNSPKYRKIPLCPVHRGACSSQDTFCLLDAKAVGRLLACLDHDNVEVVKAALSAICTLLDDKVDVNKSVSILNGVNTIQHVLNMVREHKEECLWQKSFWVIERFLRKGGDRSASDISKDRLLHVALVSAFHHGEGSTKQMAGNILRYLNKMPNFTANFTM